jgi:hypothetical protein
MVDYKQSYLLLDENLQLEVGSRFQRATRCRRLKVGRAMALGYLTLITKPLLSLTAQYYCATIENLADLVEHIRGRSCCEVRLS